LKKLRIENMRQLLLTPPHVLLRRKNFGEATLRQVRDAVERAILVQEGLPGADLDYSSLRSMTDSFVTAAIPNPRHVDIVLRRMNVLDEPHTYAAIAKLYGVTRARVGQVCSAADSRLRRTPSLARLNRLWTLVSRALRQAGGIIGYSDLAKEMCSEFCWTETPRADILESLLALNSVFVLDPDNEYVISQTFPCPRCDYARNHLEAILGDSSELHVLDVAHRLTARCGTACPRDERSPEAFSTAFVTYLVNASTKWDIVDDRVLPRGEWVRRYGNRLHEVVKVTLEQIGHPVHYSELAARIRQDNEKQHDLSDRSVHACLGHYADDFTLVERGTYGLASWDSRPYKTHAEAIIELLEEVGEPMQGHQIVSKLTRDGGYKESNLRAALGQHPSIVKISQDTYDLAERAYAPHQATCKEDLVIMLGHNRRPNFGTQGIAINDAFLESRLESPTVSQSQGARRSHLRSTPSAVTSENKAQVPDIGKLLQITTSHMNTSYKPVLMLTVLDHLDAGGDGLALEEVARDFLRYYRERMSLSLPIEDSTSTIRGLLACHDETLSTRRAVTLLLKHPLRILVEHAVLDVIDGRVLPTPTVQHILKEPLHRIKLRTAIGEALSTYYEELVRSGR
jgi:hypothetical protein